MNDYQKSKEELIEELNILRNKNKQFSTEEMVLHHSDFEGTEGLFRLITENTTENIAITTFDLKATYLYVNPSVKTVLDYNPEDLVGKSFFDFIHPEDKKVIFPLLKKYVQEKIKKFLLLEDKNVSETLEYRFKSKHGDWRILKSTITIAGKHLLAVSRDITEEKKAEQQLIESEERFRSLFEYNQAIMLLVDSKNGSIVDVNESACRYYGWSKEEFLSKNISEINTLSPEEIRHKMNLAIKQKNNYFEFRHRLADGSIREVQVYSGPVVINQMTLLYTLVFDITNQKKMEKERAMLESQLRRSQKLETIGTLAGGIAHDFNNILSPIMGFTELALLKTENGSPIQNDLKQVLKGTRRAKELVEQILLFSKQSEKEREPIYLQELVKEALKLLRPSIPTTVKIKKTIDMTCPKVLADPIQIHQVLVNLCTNAWQAMEKSGGILSIELKQVHLEEQKFQHNTVLEPASYVVLSIKDTGIGMDEATLERIYEPFFTTKQVNKGTGLGLLVVHGIVRSHKGEILVETKPGHGSAFNIYLPVSISSSDKSDAESKPLKGGTENILIVDDEEDISLMAKTILEEYGYKVKAFNNPTATFKAFLRNPQNFDLLISDLTMPQMTGIELAQKFHKKQATFPIIIMTGFGDDLSANVQFHSGINRVLSKPISVNELVRTVRTVLDNQNSISSMEPTE